MVIYNVLFKHVEKHVVPYCKAFKDLEKAKHYIYETIENCTWLKSMSTMDSEYFPELGSFTDVRCEDDEGNTYYFVIYVQNLIE